MDARLYQAALTGNVDILKELLQRDERILDRIPVQKEFGIDETPLHTSALQGHVDFAREILRHKPQLACIPNSQGSLPLHLAAAKDHVAIVQELLNVTEKISEMCLARDRQGQTPLHVAAAAGSVKVLSVLVHANPAAMRAPTLEGDFVFHLCVKGNHFAALKLLVESADDPKFINLKDSEGNTVLHLATAKKNIQVLEIILGVGGVDVEAKNEHGFTALDVFSHSPNESEDSKIVKILKKAGCKRATKGAGRNEEELMKEIRTNYLIAATLIATVTFTAGITPPGSVWTNEAPAPAPSRPNYRKGHTPTEHGDPGTAIFTRKDLYYVFLVSNTFGFLASCSVIILLLITWGRTGLKIRCLRMLLSTAMSLAIVSMIVAFGVGAALVSFQPGTTPVSLIGYYVWFLVVFISYFAYKYLNKEDLYCAYKYLNKEDFCIWKAKRPSRGTATDIEVGP